MSGRPPENAQYCGKGWGWGGQFHKELGGHHVMSDAMAFVCPAVSRE